MVERQPLYPNQQLRQVVLETKFPGRMAAMTRLDEVQDALGATFRHLFVPNFVSGEPIALKPFQLRSDEGDMLEVAVNQATFSTLVYPGGPEFVRRAEKVLSVVYGIAGVSQVTRLVYRYENEIKIEGVDDTSSLGGVLSPAWIARLFPVTMASVTFDWVEILNESDRLGVRLEFLAPATERNTLRLNLAGACGNPKIPTINVADVGSVAHRARALARERFEAMISQEFRTFLGGE